MYYRLSRTISIVFALTLMAGCAAVAYEDDYPRHHRGPEQIPPGHRPPPGQCRIWYPGEPPGQQPPPGDCRQLRRQVPPGAILVEG